MIVLHYVQAAEGSASDRTTDFAELRRQLDVADADIALVNLPKPRIKPGEVMRPC